VHAAGLTYLGFSGAGGPGFDFELWVPHLSGRMTSGSFDIRLFIGRLAQPLNFRVAHARGF